MCSATTGSAVWSRPSLMARPAGSLVLAALALASEANAQQVAEIDFTSGRTILEDEWRGLGASLVAVDWERSVLYAHDDEEPNGIMAFSLLTGEWIRTIRTPRGEGPYEFSQGRVDIDLAPGGGIYVSGYSRVVEYDSLGTPVDSWTPAAAPLPGRVCGLNGHPAVPTREGVVRRGPDGTSVAVGPPWAHPRFRSRASCHRG